MLAVAQGNNFFVLNWDNFETGLSAQKELLGLPSESLQSLFTNSDDICWSLKPLHKYICSFLKDRLLSEQLK